MSEFHRRVEEQIPRLRRYALALVHDREAADDLVKATLLGALARRHLCEHGTDLRAWLFAIMQEQNIAAVRRMGDPTVSRKLHAFHRALGQLPKEQRETILLVGLEGMAYREVAAIVGVPAATVRARHSSGCDSLRRLLNLPDRATGSDAQASVLGAAA